jgi:putative NADPH-quinone reductase
MWEPWTRVLVIYCHPVAESFCAAAHARVLKALADSGHAVTDVGLYTFAVAYIKRSR